MFKIKQQWIAPEWEDALKQADLLNIESVSKREFDWFEAAQSPPRWLEWRHASRAQP